MARILAMDYGGKRTGIAVTDELQLIASGLTTVKTGELIDFLKDYVRKESVALFVVGQPKRMNNEFSDVEHQILQFLKKLKTEIPQIPVERVDERFTSKIAFQSLIDSGVKKKKPAEKRIVG